MEGIVVMCRLAGQLGLQWTLEVLAMVIRRMEGQGINGDKPKKGMRTSADRVCGKCRENKYDHF